MEPSPSGAPSNATGAAASLVSRSAAENQERQSESDMHDGYNSGPPASSRQDVFLGAAAA
jgi:hypothetical protein